MFNFRRVDKKLSELTFKLNSCFPEGGEGTFFTKFAKIILQRPLFASFKWFILNGKMILR